MLQPPPLNWFTPPKLTQRHACAVTAHARLLSPERRALVIFKIQNCIRFLSPISRFLNTFDVLEFWNPCKSLFFVGRIQFLQCLVLFEFQKRRTIVTNRSPMRIFTQLFWMFEDRRSTPLQWQLFPWPWMHDFSRCILCSDLEQAVTVKTQPTRTAVTACAKSLSDLR